MNNTARIYLHGCCTDFLDFSLTMFNNCVWKINNDVVDLQRVSEPIHETLNGDLKPCRFLRGIAQAHMVRFFSFLSPYATELRTGIREENQQRRKSQPLCVARSESQARQ